LPVIIHAYCQNKGAVLARALQVLSDPYYQSTCLSVRKFDAKYIFLETKRLGVRVQ